jgi:dsRNA-specific ribonuclease
MRTLRFWLSNCQTQEKMRNRRAYFIIHLYISNKFISAGEGFSKKIAEQNAAMNGLKILGIAEVGPEV